MSTVNVEALLREYNKELYSKNTQTPSDTSAAPKLGGASYVSPIEYMLDRYQSDNNFDSSMFNEATKLGDEETYLSLVAKNEGHQLSEQFYDPKYRTYESTILELYKGLADNENKEEQFIEEFDPATGEWNEVSIGEMTERERIQYDLDQAYAARDAEITKQLEQYRKETMSFLEKAGSHTAAVGLEFTEGVTMALAGVLDFGLGFFAAAAAGIEGENFLDAYVNYFGTQGLVAMDKEYFRAAIDEYERKYTTFRTIDGNLTGVGKYVAGITNSIGMMLPSILLSIPTGGTSLAWLGSASFYAAIFSGNMYDNATRQETLGSPSWVKITNAAFTAAAEYAIEWGLGKVLGGTIQNSLIGLGGKGLPGGIRELSKLAGFQYLLKSAGQEGLEEFLQDFGTHCINECYALWSEGYGQDGVSLQTLMDAFFAGVLSSFVLSGAAIGRNRIDTFAKNAKAKKEGTYDKTHKIGPGDMVIETKPGEYKKIGGATRLYYSSILADFNEALRTLENSRGNIKDIKLAQEVYAGINELSQYFASFDQKRLENCQKLLDRVITFENAATSDPAKTRRAATVEFAKELSETFREMQVSPHMSSRVIAALEKANVTKVTGTAKKNGAKKRKSKKGESAAEALSRLGATAKNTEAEQENELSAKAEQTLEELVKDYGLVITTDGHIAIAEGDTLFVSDAWLENYSSTEIYRFLAQSKILETLASAKNYQKLIERVWEFAEKFTGKTLDWEEAVMNLFFNENMYQSFLLSNSGENFHEFAEFLSMLPKVIHDLAEQSAIPVEKAMIEKVFEDMKATMRLPTIKAIVNWNYAPQKVLADIILPQSDLERIQQIKKRTETLAQGSGGAYERLAKDLLEIGEFTEEEKAFIQKTLDDPNASDRDRLVVQAMLDEADRRFTVYTPSSLAHVEILREHLKALDAYSMKGPSTKTVGAFGSNPRELYFNNLARSLSSVISFFDALLKQIDADGISLSDDLRRVIFLYRDEFQRILQTQSYDGISGIVISVEDILPDIKQEIYEESTRLRPGLGAGSFTIDPRAFFEGAEKAEEIQHVNDVLEEFVKLYGIPADQMYVRTLDGITRDNYDKLQADMVAMGVDDYQVFVTRKLEQMLGPDHIVAPSYEQQYYNVEPFSFVNKKAAERFWNMYLEALDFVSEIGRDYDTNKGKPVSVEVGGVIGQLVDTLAILSSPASKYNERPELSTELSAKLQKLFDALKTKSNAEIRKYVATHWKSFDDIRLQIMDELEISVFGPEPIDNYITDFKIAKKIPAEKLLVPELVEGTREDRDRRLIDLLSADRLDPSFRQRLLDFYYDLYGYAADELDFSTLPEDWEINLIDGVNSYTGEVMDDNNLSEEDFAQYMLLRDEFLVSRQGVSVADLLAIDNERLHRHLSDWHILLDEHLSARGETSFTNKTVTLNSNEDDIFGTFVHEINHVLQREMGLSPGGSSSITGNAELLVHLCNNYREYVRYVAMRRYDIDTTNWLFELADRKITEEDIRNPKYSNPYSSEPELSLYRTLTYCAYRLLSGEMWAEHYDHNGRPVRGYARTIENGEMYIVTPDGKERFPLSDAFVGQLSQLSVDANAKLPPELAGAAMVEELKTIHQIRRDADSTSYRASDEIRNTYHAGWTKGSAISVLIDTGIVSKETVISEAIYGWPVTIDRVIKNPEYFLSKEFIDEMLEYREDLSEGNVFYYLKEWIEEHAPGISIDRSSDDHEYILVDDNAFDDLLLPKIANKADSDGKTLVQKFPDGEATLGDFYHVPVLRKLGIDPNIPVVISSSVRSEFVVNKYNPLGIIYINANADTRDVRIVDTLNHEFRHLMQRYNRFEGGFSPSITVSDEMVADFEKHVPALFTDASVNKWAKKATEKSGESWKKFIIRQAIYTFTGGELNAFGITANYLTTKPIYASYEGGKVTVFLPWYNSKTGEGRHVVSHLAYREDEGTPAIPGAKKKSRGKKKPFKGEAFKDRTGEPGPGFDIPVDDIDDPRFAKDLRARYVSKKRAEGTNLEYYTKNLKPGEQAQIDPRIQDFVLAVDLAKLDPVLANGIEKGVLNMQTLRQWLIHSETDLTKVNDYTVRMIAKHIFRNDYFKTGRQLETFVGKLQVGTWWAAAVVFRGGLKNEGNVDRVAVESMLAKNTLEDFLAFYRSLEGGRWAKAIDKKAPDFLKFWVDGTQQVVEVNPAVQRAARLFALRYFNGSLAGAFHASEVFRHAIVQYENEVGHFVSIDSPTKNAKGENNSGTLADTLTKRNEIKGLDGVIKDLYALYQAGVADDLDLDEERLNQMRQELAVAKIQSEDWDVTDETQKAALKSWLKELYSRDNAALAAIYEQYELYGIVSLTIEGHDVNKEAETVKYVLNDYDPHTNRVNIAGRVKRAGNKLAKILNEGKFFFDNLPNEVRELFGREELEVVTPEDKTKRKKPKKPKKPDTRVEYALKPSAYSVGCGAAELSSERDENRMRYSGKKDLSDLRAGRKHDVAQILANEAIIKNTLKELAAIEKRATSGDPEAARLVKGRVRTVTFDIREKVTVKKIKEELGDKIEGASHETSITVRKKRATHTKSDTPNHFTIVSNVEMPEPLRKIFDTSFNEMADTLVQFASKDKDGKLYTKEDKEFESRMQHEITNWEAFYTANYGNLVNLTRADVLAIVDFFQNGVSTLNGPMGKFAAFEIFTLGYILDAGRHESLGWHLSQAELDVVRSIYEAKASALGSGLNAVQQMRDVINPFRQIQERYFEVFNILPDETDDLLAAIDLMEEARTDDERTKSYALVEAEINKIEALARSRNVKTKGERAADMLKSWRYTAMLSSPATWARNAVSNVTTEWFIKGSDWFGNLFAKKGYRKDQWNLNGVQVTDEVRDFIKTFFMDNPQFEVLYEHSSKYDDQLKAKRNGDAGGPLVQMIAKALEKKFAAESHWPVEIMNKVTVFVQKMISDKRFVKKATEKYFGKMLTIAIQQGKANINDGLSSKGVLEVFSEAIILANNDYMHKRNFISDMFDSIKITHPVAYNALVLWQPFATAGFNWFVESLKYSPAGLIANIVRLCKLEATIARQAELRKRGRSIPDTRFTEYLVRRDIGKGIIGAILWSFGAFLALAGVVRITEEDENVFYITVGNIKLDISEIFGASSLLVGASIMQAFVTQADGTKMNFDKVFGLFSQYFFDGFIISDLLERHKWDSDAGEMLVVEAESFLKSYVPQFWQLFVRATSNAKIKYSAGIMGMFERWANSFVPTMPAGSLRVNPYTGELETKYALPVVGELLKSGFLTGGVRILYSEVSEQEIFAREYGVNKNALLPEIAVDGKKRSLSDAQTLNQVYGKLNAEDLKKIKSQRHRVEMPNGTYKTLSWDQMSKDQRTNVIERTFTNNATIAKIYMWTQKMGHKYYASPDVYTELKAMGMTKNVFRGDKGFVE